MKNWKATKGPLILSCLQLTRLFAGEASLQLMPMNTVQAGVGYLVFFLLALALVPVAVTLPVSVVATCIPTMVMPSMVAIPILPHSVTWSLTILSAVAICSAVRSLPDIMATSVVASVWPGGL